ncbi:hypothetical protein HER10_EVM0010187 [Colletotrichum scovillei]|uniref:uncharacterized protein n=1 Tax=Colletotrichum scovillei TaxID=1209932 RepID=UPI0015C32C28|nr:uncharacterized protein HER10_EVM0010187 [Colletotrichum scovillei]KAF4776947.1 hypothetical protein HER10_EVM0010187 [Colletotrichum scovillei]
MADQNLPEMSASDVNFMCHTRWGQIKRKFAPADQATPKKKASQASASTPTSASKVKKTTGRVGAKAAKGKKIVKDEEEEEEADDDKDVIKTKEEVFDI